jgi:hypothetical protein
MKIAASSRKEYFAASGDREASLRKLDRLIRKAAPTLKPFFLETASMTMLGYGKLHYKYPGGREGVWAFIGQAAQKNNISLYGCVVRDGRYLPEIYNKRLGKVSCGKSCIRFKRFEDLDVATVEEICREAAQLVRSGQNFQM